jgi:DNA-binding CsgD family transcriptional regulator
MQADVIKSLRLAESIVPDETDDLMRRLVDQLREQSPRRTDAADGAVICSAEVDGFRYQLTRIPCAARSVALSPREKEIARMVAKGLPDKAIAAVLEISRYTVGTHLRRMYAKAGVASRAAMVAKIMAGNLWR